MKLTQLDYGIFAVTLIALSMMAFDLLNSYTEPQAKPNYETTYLFDGEPQDIQSTQGIYVFQQTDNPQWGE